jgi:hypothetical protein
MPPEKSDGAANDLRHFYSQPEMQVPKVTHHYHGANCAVFPGSWRSGWMGGDTGTAVMMEHCRQWNGAAMGVAGKGLGLRT